MEITKFTLGVWLRCGKCEPAWFEEEKSQLQWLFLIFVEQVVPFPPPPLEILPAESAQKGPGSAETCCDWWGWQTRFHGAQCQVLCLHNVLLYLTIYHPLCPNTGNKMMNRPS